MGLAASQCRLLFITSRQNDVSAKMQKISHDRLSLSNKADDLAVEYDRRASATKFVMADDSDLSYSTLMGEGAAAVGSGSYLTNTSGKVVLDANYFSALRIASGKTSGTGADFGVDKKTFIHYMSGIDLDKIKEIKTEAQFLEDANLYSVTLGENSGSFKSVYGTKPSETPTTSEQEFTKADLLNKINEINGVGINNTDKGYNLGSNRDKAVKYVADYISNMGYGLKCVLGIDATKQSAMATAIDTTVSDTKASYNSVKDGGTHGSGSDASSGAVGIYEVNTNTGKGDPSKSCYIDWTTLNGEFYKNLQKNVNGVQGNVNASVRLSVETECTNEKGISYSAWNTAYNTAHQKYEEYVEREGGDSLSDVEKNQVAFYTEVFNKASNGWAYDEDANDSSKLMNKLANGTYMLNNRNAVANGTIKEVADEEAKEAAERWYEREKGKIQRKEKEMDTELTQRQTEYNALTNDYNSVKSIIDANVQKSFTYCQNG